jgi:hypothetical protein
MKIIPLLRCGKQTQTNPIAEKPKNERNLIFNKRLWESAASQARKNKPNQTNPIKPNFKIGKMNATFFSTKPYTSKQRAVIQNKPNQTQTNVPPDTQNRTPRPVLRGWTTADSSLAPRPLLTNAPKNGTLPTVRTTCVIERCKRPETKYTMSCSS